MSDESRIGVGDVAGVVGFVGLLLACGARANYTEPRSFPPQQVRLGNVELAPDATLQQATEPNFKGYAPTSDSWIMGRGIAREYHPSGPEAYVCGAPVVVKGSDGKTAHGRLIVYHVMENSSGPAGKGNYLVHVPDSRIDATSGGRISVAYERYDTVYNGTRDENVAWIVFVSEEPLACN